MKIKLNKNELIALIIASENFIKDSHFKKPYQNKAIRTAHNKLMKELNKYPSKPIKELN